MKWSKCTLTGHKHNSGQTDDPTCHASVMLMTCWYQRVRYAYDDALYKFMFHHHLKLY